VFFLPGFFTLPPLDRDEARFAQATKQMVETGELIEIRFQDGARNKKPVGIYWLQALPASLLSGPEHNRIWAYRLPSLVAGILAVLLTHAIGAALFDRRTGLVAGALLASSTLLVVEAGIAKTDAALLTATLLSLWALARAWMARTHSEPLPKRVSASFWIGIGAGLLLKGPVIVMSLGLPLVVLALWQGSAAWLRKLRPLSGSLMTMAIALPWFIAIYFATDGAFYAEALGKDFGGKITSGQESHGAPPGLYLVLVWLTFWPASLLLIPAVLWGISERANESVRFVIAWALPSWIVIELIPTKLPHYALPLYPALALIIAAALMTALTKREAKDLFKSWAARLGLLLWVLPATLLVSAISILPIYFGTGYSVALGISSGLGMALILSTTIFHLRGEVLRATLTASLTGLFVFAFLFEAAMAQMDDLRLSPRLHERLGQSDIPQGAVFTGIFGYSEPSFVFLHGTKTRLLAGKSVLPFLEGGGKVLIVDQAREEALETLLEGTLWRLKPVDVVRGQNYSKGRDMVLTIYTVSRASS
jgi:4-amino-4-deoxy-L-arabinose transferase-like glycosyltransferase